MNAEISEPQAIASLKLIFSALRKISDDLILCFDEEKFSIRSLNSTRSALPVIKFKQDFFKTYKYFSVQEKIVAQIPVAAIIMAFKNASNPTLLSFQIPDSDSYQFIVSLVDKYTITHTWEFPLSEAHFLNAIFDLNETCVEVKCRFDVFNGLSEAFKNINTIYMDINSNSKKGAIYFKSSSSDDSNGSLSSTLKIQKSERCEVQISEDVTQMQIAFSLPDFIVGVKIAKLLSQFFTIHIIGPGQPLILRANSTNLIQFEMPLATVSEADDDEDNQTEQAANEESTDINQNDNYDFSNNYNSRYNNANKDNDNDGQFTSNSAEMSQVSAWQINPPPNSSQGSSTTVISVKENSSSVQFDSAASSLTDRKPSRISQTLANGLYAESPPFPTKRRMAGPNTIAQASQPPSEDEDSV
ncbi:hypothetical protein TRFO_07340 [Tritrichomonas foetus]|uniref:Proliferating cell nuclear antigen n=1 Tax=Tritrichomonas foetus TaxID=1144522 RepID=A0A1J4JSR2_9EUKA|nr:hypothetical protein TRFO_07340 [Tritrichomonas foetus]|eukprot:OHT01794.1 hypothetical protein TRFO_07340 [Tritrichomonas foetus]